jgi:hypothetical protein
MVYLDFRSLSLIGALRRVCRGSGRRLFPYSRRFTFTEPHRRVGRPPLTPAKLSMPPLGGGGSQVGRGGESAGGKGGRGVKGVYFKF